VVCVCVQCRQVRCARVVAAAIAPWSSLENAYFPFMSIAYRRTAKWGGAGRVRDRSEMSFLPRRSIRAYSNGGVTVEGAFFRVLYSSAGEATAIRESPSAAGKLTRRYAPRGVTSAVHSRHENLECE